MDEWRVLVLLLCGVVSSNAKVILIESGLINGTTMEARNGRTFNAFLGIPYAEPPVGKLRLQPPKPIGSWYDIQDCTVNPLCCLQWDKENKNGTLGSEDCLYINVYTPLNAKKGDRLPVMFYIYGGVFKTGSNIINGPQYFMGSDIIIVIPNFRGGALGTKAVVDFGCATSGVSRLALHREQNIPVHYFLRRVKPVYSREESFLSTGDTVIPGNFGLKDQLLALKWTQQNVEYFGGDPNKVTIQGHSSGAVMVHMHTIAPASKGLFQQATIMSGTGFCALAYFDQGVSGSIAREFATRVNCSTRSSEEMQKCFMELDADLFATVAEEMYVWNKEPDATFRPTVEDKRVEDAFLNEVPNKLGYHSPHLPMLIGVTTGEGAMKTKGYLAGEGVVAEEVDDEYKLLFPISLQYLWHAKSRFMDFTSAILRTHYFGQKEIGLETYQNITDLYTHGLFGVCTMEAITKYEGPRYVYHFDYVSNYSLYNSRLENPPMFLGISHADELSLFFYKEKRSQYLSAQDEMVSEELVKRWVNFIQSGNPNHPTKINKTMMGPWSPVKSNRIEYLRIDINGSMETDLYAGTYSFWKRLPLFSKYYN